MREVARVSKEVHLAVLSFQLLHVASALLANAGYKGKLKKRTCVRNANTSANGAASIIPHSILVYCIADTIGRCHVNGIPGKRKGGTFPRQAG